MPHHLSEEIERSPMGRSKPDDDDQDESESPCLLESLVEEIILRLPLKSVFRFKCVSKSWLYRLSEPSFACKYLSAKKNFTPSWTLICTIMMHGKEEMLEQKGFRNLSLDGCISPTISYICLPSVGKILASSNGLLLCGDNVQERYNLYNPLTQQMLSLPKPVTWVDYHVQGLLTRMDQHGVVVESYKVVQVRTIRFDHANPCFLDVFCSESGVWTTYELHSPHRYEISPTAISLKETLYLFDYYNGVILAYSPYADPYKLHLIHLPDGNVGGQPGFGRRRQCGGTCRERLRYYALGLSNGGPVQKVWELIDARKGEWRLVHSNFTGSYKLLWSIQSLNPKNYCLIGFDPIDHDLMYFGKAECIYSFHMATRKLELLHQLDRRFTDDIYWDSFTSYELQSWPTLIPPPTWTTGNT